MLQAGLWTEVCHNKEEMSLKKLPLECETSCEFSINSTFLLPDLRIRKTSCKYDINHFLGTEFTVLQWVGSVFY